MVWTGHTQLLRYSLRGAAVNRTNPRGSTVVREALEPIALTLLSLLLQAYIANNLLVDINKEGEYLQKNPNFKD